MSTKSSVQRFLPLDVFRGITVCFMIIVNTPGSGVSYAPLEHAAWHGFTPTDLVFPSFLFAVGNAMSFAMKKFETMRTQDVLQKIFKRTLIIFLLGYIVSWIAHIHIVDGHVDLQPFSQTRILGVLERIALCYCIASLLIMYCSTSVVWIISIALLFIYWGLMHFFGDPGDFYTLHGNAELKLDLLVMGPDHLYHGEGVPFDPEGILSTLPAIVNVVAGYYTGLYVQKYRNDNKRLWQLAAIGILLIVLAICWNPFFPINKKLWTSSFVLHTVGIDLLILSFLIFVIDKLGFTSWTGFFTVFGRNPLFLYLLSELLLILLWMIPVGGGNPISWVNEHLFQRYWPGAFGSLLFAVSYMLLCWAVGKLLDWRKIYVRV
ncbi:Predicted acyltransferase [Chitinophaga costaii]|uniref:Predicted acyltransferase n=1 Tax=Chitinophaga costaii TaxID=1335309 RepID=A0A1C4AH37_9BACT|nr:DUF5009 domain-containing protein [Chitinophaga costaii]PUZ26602.1 DUF5009 domain-containing protein [Chitinophaga costaii]SCB93962.1 Predicted acyltransferase [Chitinophaga costaii]